MAEPQTDARPGERPLAEVTSAATAGGRALMLRQTVTLVVAAVGGVLLAREIGTAAYGIYTVVFELLFFAQASFEFNLDVFIVRRLTVSKEVLDTVFTLLAASAVLGTAAMFALRPVLSTFLRVPDFPAVAAVMFLTLPVMHLQQVPLSKLEREFVYRTIGMVELLGQCAYVAVALPLAFLGAGVWSPVCGWCVQQVTLLTGFWVRGGYRPALRVDVGLVREALSFGLAVTAANWATSARNLVNPLIVTKVLGVRSAAVVGLTLNLLQQVGFIKQVIFRIALSFVAQVKSDAQLFAKAVSYGTVLQLLTVGLPVICFSVLAQFVIPVVFGPEWRGAAVVFQLIAPSFLALIGTTIFIAALATEATPWIIALPAALNTAILFAAAWLLVPIFGVRGYGYAELCSVASAGVTLFAARRRFPTIRLAESVTWWVCLSAAAAGPILSDWMLATVLLPVLVPACRRQVVELVRLARQRPGQDRGPTLDRKAPA